MTSQEVDPGKAPARGPSMNAFRTDPPHRRNEAEESSERPAAEQDRSQQELPLPAAEAQPPREPDRAATDALGLQLRALSEAPPPGPAPVPSWWRKLLHLGPSKSALDAADAAEAERRATSIRKVKLRSQFAETLTIAVASPKGSAGKTPTARGIAAAFGRERGGGVVAVDMNELRGTLAQRSVTTHDGHIGGLVDSAEYLLGAHARSVEVERCMNRQPDSYEWVLASDPGTTVPLSAEDFTTVHTILKRFYPILVLDTGNAELASSWQAATREADLLVVPMKWRGDHIRPAAEMLTSMVHRGERVAGRTVIVGTNAPGEADLLAKEEAARFFKGLPIVEIPADPALNAAIIRWEELRPETQTAFEVLAATLTDLAKGATS